eukprot:GHVL01001504.1.p1 GENE.GHVL01001504.1~~GHVL01001504.1.p1  ORF type:complete len:426 (+),score=92.72 GHVL01001504.1:664-1941(+)
MKILNETPPYETPPLNNLQNINNVTNVSLELGGRLRKYLINDRETDIEVSQIDKIIIIDRRVDLMSILCTDFTYEGLLDNTFGIQNSYVKVDPAIVANKNREPVTVVPLNSNDKLFQEIRNLHIGILGPILHKKANDVHQMYKEKDSLTDISEMKLFMKKFKNLQAQHSTLTSHVNLASYINNKQKEEAYMKALQIEDEIMLGSPSSSVFNYIEELIDSNENPFQVLRLMCLISVVNNGLKQKQYYQLKKAIVQVYGGEWQMDLMHLATVGALRCSESGKCLWPAIMKGFNLHVPEEEAENDIAFVFSGYAPLTVRLVQMSHSTPQGWLDCQDLLNLLWGPAVAMTQKPSNAVEEKEVNYLRNEFTETDPQVVLVFFVGGVSFAEIAALRRLSKIENNKRKFVICTTEIINFRILLNSLRESQNI